ncbi:hypothetical protein FRX31_011693 [Thalictrum thalictroides]|uniref:Uncharacterized protein n=1 Tax=Thalictrum thalictroides TaxID=46969 RepID=A0A7J6WMW7_THATH|nr:hypothetical protein FRX31_011693 [Thalictrum thalictroides]
MAEQPQDNDATTDNLILRCWNDLKRWLLKELLEFLPTIFAALKPGISKIVASFPLRLYGVNVVVIVIAIHSLLVSVLWELLRMWRGLQETVVVSMTTMELHERLRPALVLYRFSTPSRSFGTGLVLHHSSFMGFALIDKCKVIPNAELKLSFPTSRRTIDGEEKCFAFMNGNHCHADGRRCSQRLSLHYLKNNENVLDLIDVYESGHEKINDNEEVEVIGERDGHLGIIEVIEIDDEAKPLV